MPGFAEPADEGIGLDFDVAVWLVVGQPLENGSQRADTGSRELGLESFGGEDSRERLRGEVHEMVAAVEGRCALVQNAAGETCDVRDDDEESSTGTKEGQNIGEHRAWVVYMFAHREQHDCVEGLRLEARLGQR